MDLVRKRVWKEYYMRRENFDTEDEYNDYLEEFEEIVYNLQMREDLEKTKELLSKRREQCKNLVKENIAKRAVEEREIQSKISRYERETKKFKEETSSNEVKEAEASELLKKTVFEEIVSGNAQSVDEAKQILQVREIAEKESAKQGLEGEKNRHLMEISLDPTAGRYIPDVRAPERPEVDQSAKRVTEKRSRRLPEDHPLTQFSHDNATRRALREALAMLDI